MNALDAYYNKKESGVSISDIRLSVDHCRGLLSLINPKHLRRALRNAGQYIILYGSKPAYLEISWIDEVSWPGNLYFKWYDCSESENQRYGTGPLGPRPQAQRVTGGYRFHSQAI